jgi:hypothetical protein
MARWLVVLLMAAASAFAEDAKPVDQPLKPEEVKRLVGELGNDDYAVRDNASRQLMQAGEEALEAVAAAREADDAEIASRARKIYEALSQRVLVEHRTGDFLVAGPFQFEHKEGSSGLELVHPPEEDKAVTLDAQVDLNKEYTWTGPDGAKTALKWQRPGKGKTGLIDFVQAFGKQIDWANVYALTFIKAEKESDAKLFIGSDDGIIVWINREQVHKNDVQRPLKADEDTVSIKLKPGWNAVLIKVQQGVGGWSLSMRVADVFGKRWPKEWVDPAQGKP